jgi:hypothetical protein
VRERPPGEAAGKPLRGAPPLPRQEHRCVGLHDGHPLLLPGRLLPAGSGLLRSLCHGYDGEKEKEKEKGTERYASPLAGEAAPKGRSSRRKPNLEPRNRRGRVRPTRVGEREALSVEAETK